MRPNLTLVIPAYNEERRIGKTLQQYINYFNSKYNENYEILVVLNGCKDRTIEVLKQFSEKYKVVKYLNFPAPIGKGGAIAQGFKFAQGQYIGFTDADGATPAEEMGMLFETLQAVPLAASVIGSRRLPTSIVTGKSSQRYIFSWGFNAGVNLLFNLGIKDTQCGAKVISREMLNAILPCLSVSNMAFDVNFLLEIKKHGGTILEVPIKWNDQPDSTIKKPAKTSLIMALSVIKLWMLNTPNQILYKLFKPAGVVLWHALLSSNEREFRHISLTFDDFEFSEKKHETRTNTAYLKEKLSLSN